MTLKRRFLLHFVTALVVTRVSFAARSQEVVQPTGNASNPQSSVTFEEDQESFTLANGIVKVRVEKKSGAVVSLLYRGYDLVKDGRGYWSKVGGPKIGAFKTATVRINPKANNGERVEVSCRAPYDGEALHFPADVEMRYSLGRGESGFYASMVWEHKPEYPAFSVGEARFLFRLNPAVFDSMTIDAERRGPMPTPEDWNNGTPLNMKEVRRLNTGKFVGKAEHKYGYSAIIPETPAYGWSSSKDNFGLWLVNPSYEYFAGGPTKVELTGHLDVNAPGSPILLNMWLGSHYGGSVLQVDQGESWQKVIGPFFVLCNSAPDQDALWNDALQFARQEKQKWPYSWAADEKYPAVSKRATVTGRIVLQDSVAPTRKAGALHVGLTAPDYEIPAAQGFTSTVDWQRDAKYYQFWTRTELDGRFSIPHVRPGKYTIHAFTDGVLGEFAQTDVVVKAGEKLNLGDLVWIPKQFGRTLWEIGVPNRSAAEFRHGDEYWKWGLYHLYTKEFPDDVNYVIGKSSPRTDWNYAQPPRMTKISENGVVDKADLQPSTWTIRFPVEQVKRGKATLRLAFCGSRLKCNVAVGVNGKAVGDTGELPSTGVMHRDGIRGYWYERDVAFDASLLKQGENSITLTLLPSTDWPQAVMYDYLRLELEETSFS